MAIVSVTYNENRRGERLVTIKQDIATLTEVKIGNYTKVIKEQEQTINLTPYLLEELWATGSLIEPFTGSVKNSEHWGVIPSVEINGTVYSDNTLYVPHEGRFVSNSVYKATALPYLLYRPNYPIQFIVGGVSADYSVPNTSLLDSIQNTDGVRSFVGYTEAVDSKSKSLKLTRLGQTWELRRFDAGKYSTCLKWINQHGMPDKWYFNFLREKNLVTTAETIYTQDGYTKLNRQGELQYLIETRELGKEALDALSYILVSPRVWLVDEDDTNYEEIDIITEECRTYSDRELSTLQIAFRYKERRVW